MRNPRNRTLDHRTRFAASYPDNRASTGATTTTSGDPCTQDIGTRKKTVRFGEGTTCSIESESEAMANLSDAEAPKTSEYAFFKKLRQDAGRPVPPAQKESSKRVECKSGDCSDNPGVGNRISQCFQNLKFSLHAQDVRPLDPSLLLSPTAGPSKTADMNSLEQHQLQFPNAEFTHPIRKEMHVAFEASHSPFRDRVKSAVASYVYGQGNIFSAKRDKLLQLVADTYPESKNNNLNGVDLVNAMLRRLFPNSDDTKHILRAGKLRQQDACTSWLPSFPESTADYEKLSWPEHHGLREAGDLMLLDYGCMSSDSTDLAIWSGEYNMSPDTSSVPEHIHYKMKKPYNISDYVRSRIPWKNILPTQLPCETLVSHTPSDIISHHWDDLPTGQNFLLGWVDETTEDEDQMQIAPYYGMSLHSNCQTLQKNAFQLGTDSDSSLSRTPPPFASGHYDNMDRYFKTMEETDKYVATDYGLEDMETNSRDIIHSRNPNSYFTNKDGDSCLPYMNSHLLLSTPSVFAKQELIPSDYPRGQIMCINQPWEVCVKEVTSLNYPSHDCHLHTDGVYQIRYPDEPSFDQTTYHTIFPLGLDGENVPFRTLNSFP